ncbi:MAG: hypothetical protein AAGA66_14415 [Bacteroidota bacterium]
MILVILSVTLSLCDPMFDIEPKEKIILNEQKIDLLFKKCKPEKREDLTEFLNWSSEVVFILEDGKVLSASLSRGTKTKKFYHGALYGSEEYFIEEVNQFRIDINLANSFKPFTCEIMNKDFISAIPESINKLQATFNISSDSLDYSLQSLKKIDSILSKKDMETQAKTYLDAISYLGEVVRKNVEGSEWKMNKVSEGDCRPLIVKGNKQYDPFFLYYESISEKRPSLWESAYIEIERNKLR